MSATQQTSETAGALLAKAAPPASVSVATLLGVPVSELVLWVTLIYTMLLIVHKAMAIYRDMRPCRVDVEE